MANPPRCGQFTFFFPRCSHATSHSFHLSPDAGLLCNTNCIYDQTHDYWFYANETARCSSCGLGADGGFGTRHPVPDDDKERMGFFERLLEDGKMGDKKESGNEVLMYDDRFSMAAEQCNRMVDDCATMEGRKDVQGVVESTRMVRKQNFLNRWATRRLRAQRRTEKWVANVREEQYRALKAGKQLGNRPFIVTSTPSSFMDFQVEVNRRKLLQPMANCAWCQYPLDEFEEGGKPSKLPCSHMFHSLCIGELFLKRAEAVEDQIFQCPLCKVWFADVRRLPDFWERYRGFMHDFDSDAASSVLSATEDGNRIGDLPPPWLIPQKVETSSRASRASTRRTRSQHHPILHREKPAQQEDLRLNQVRHFRHTAGPNIADPIQPLDLGISGHDFGSDTDDSNYQESTDNEDFFSAEGNWINGFDWTDARVDPNEISSRFEDESEYDDGDISGTLVQPSAPSRPSLRARYLQDAMAVPTTPRRSGREKAPPTRWAEESVEIRYNKRSRS